MCARRESRVISPFGGQGTVAYRRRRVEVLRRQIARAHAQMRMPITCALAQQMWVESDFHLKAAYLELWQLTRHVPAEGGPPYQSFPNFRSRKHAVEQKRKRLGLASQQELDSDLAEVLRLSFPEKMPLLERLQRSGARLWSSLQTLMAGPAAHAEHTARKEEQATAAQEPHPSKAADSHSPERTCHASADDGVGGSAFRRAQLELKKAQIAVLQSQISEGESAHVVAGLESSAK